MEQHQGSCLCGAVTFTVQGSLGQGEICHCDQCRQWTGHVFASVEVARDQLSFTNAEGLSWYASSNKVRRGFCKVCGSSLFFDPLDQQKHAWIGIALGSFDKPTNSKLALHIFTREKGDYYDITDGLPQE